MRGEESLRCLIAAGGTAGHVLPALAVAEALVQRGVAVTFAGPRERAGRLVPEAGFELDAFDVEGFPRRPGIPLARAVLKAGTAVVASRRIVARRRPHVVLGAGGYVGGPIAFAAATMRVPAALTEADAHLGLANRLAAPFARCVFLSFPIAGLTPPKYRVTGRAIRSTSRPRPREDSRRRLGLRDDARVVLVFGGSQGARALNDVALDAWAEQGPSVVHVCGEREHERLRPRVARDDYKLLPFVDEFGVALGAADVAVARAGSSLWELAAAGLPAVVVPYPHATANHQYRNAAYFEKGVEIVDEEELARVPTQVDSLLRDDARLARMKATMLQLARPNAAEEIADELVRLARR